MNNRVGGFALAVQNFSKAILTFVVTRFGFRSATVHLSGFIEIVSIEIDVAEIDQGQPTVRIVFDGIQPETFRCGVGEGTLGGGNEAARQNGGGDDHGYSTRN